ncbi:MAG: SDR family oxidoreductase, partial [Polyangiaceae bacterium]
MPNKVVLITGAAQGIGRAIASGFADAGWRVALGDLQKGKVAEAAAAIGKEDVALPLELNVCDERSIELAIGTLVARFGRLDALINNAALFTQLKR